MHVTRLYILEDKLFTITKNIAFSFQVYPYLQFSGCQVKHVLAKPKCQDIPYTSFQALRYIIKKMKVMHLYFNNILKLSKLVLDH